MSKISSNSNEIAVGVLITRRALRRLQKQRPPLNIIKLYQASEISNTKLYMFTLRKIHFNRNIIYGTYFNRSTKRWEERPFSFPDVLYRRSSIPNQIIQEKFKQKGVKFLNSPKGFNNWKVSQLLLKNKELSSHIPLTKKCQSINDVTQMFKRTNTVYLKSYIGGRGKKVMRIIKLPQKGYHCSYYNNQLVEYRAKTFEAFQKTIRSFYRKRFIMQEGIDLLTIDGYLVDMRAEIQRNGRGEIEVTAIAVRRGKKNSPITTHSKSYTFNSFYKNFLNYTDEQVNMFKNEVTQFLTKIYEQVEKGYGRCGEMGIDFAVDKNKKLWFIECNSRSAKVSLHKAFDNVTINRSFLNLLEYAKFIANEKNARKYVRTSITIK
ncbi:YheC/YheD family endospore coat-associated protein [Halalkalibacter okhensis]|uniref:ATP-grasp domain-containing protein n=1 Tax=Halalkalibacter okhensis TaxID=333138 RepID=A0A0B0IF24_9BACI|nr:YheC/YheD family protein [Halalkalibacter okhensis]KHF39855.1 hypothetical protein LQ50_12365 [Halalkalibacter okhensis]